MPSNVPCSDAHQGGVLLAVDDLSVRDGGVHAVRRASFTLRPGGVLAVLGPNGAGKSSLARAISGLVRPASGEVRLDDEPISGLPAHRIARKGISYIPEGRGIFPSLSVKDNLRMAVRHEKNAAGRARALATVLDLFPALASRQGQRAGTLSGGEQQMLALSKAFCGESKVLIADELSLGLAPMLVDQVFRGLAEARNQGMAVIVAEQFVERALELADACVILQRGSIVWSGSAAEAGAEVQARYLGATLEE
jgi:branched-chain amino acid transport system ATP-binding protein